MRMLAEVLPGAFLGDWVLAHMGVDILRSLGHVPCNLHDVRCGMENIENRRLRDSNMEHGFF